MWLRMYVPVGLWQGACIRARGKIAGMARFSGYFAHFQGRSFWNLRRFFSDHLFKLKRKDPKYIIHSRKF